MFELRTHNLWRKVLRERNKKIIELCRGKKVLHLGATDRPYTKEQFEKWILLHAKITDVSKETLWLDLDHDAINYLSKKWYDNIIQMDFNKINWLDYKPDVIVFGETIEHIMNLELFFQNLKKTMTNDTILIITTPNALCFIIQLLWLFGKEIVHPDHNIIFTLWTIKQLLEKNWFKVVDNYRTFLPKGRYNLFIATGFLINKLLSYIFPSLAEDLFIIAKLKIK